MFVARTSKINTMALEFNKCCFCVDLRVGSFIIGYLGLVGCIIMTLLSIVGLVASAYITVNGDTKQAQMIGGFALAVMCIVLVIVVLHLIFDIILLIGLHKNKRGHVKAYLVFVTIFIVISILAFISSIANGSPAGEIVKSLLTILFSAYFLLVIRSYYLKMDDATKRPAVYNTA